MQQQNFTRFIALRNSQELQRKLNQVIESGKARNISEAVRYCIQAVTV